MRVVGCLFSLSLAVACSSGSDHAKEPVDAGPPTVSPQACSTRCVAKAASCGASAAQASPLCGSMCSMAVTEAQAACLEGKTCAELIASGQGVSFSTLCPGLDPVQSAPIAGPTVVPPELTIATAIPSAYSVVTHDDAGQLRSSLFNVAGPPQFAPQPEAGHFPSLANSATITVVSPPRNGCDSVFNVTINARELAVSTSAVDTLPDTKCAAFMDAIAAQGLTLRVEKAPWAGSTETSTVTIALRRVASD